MGMYNLQKSKSEVQKIQEQKTPKWILQTENEEQT